MAKRLGRVAAAAATALLLGAQPAASQSEQSYVVQMASVKSAAAAEGEWQRLRKAHPILLGDMKLAVQTVELSDRGTFYRVQTGPFPNQATAEDLCWQLKSADQDCLVLRR